MAGGNCRQVRFSVVTCNVFGQTASVECAHAIIVGIIVVSEECDETLPCLHWRLSRRKVVLRPPNSTNTLRSPFFDQRPLPCLQQWPQLCHFEKAPPLAQKATELP